MAPALGIYKCKYRLFACVRLLAVLLCGHLYQIQLGAEEYLPPIGYYDATIGLSGPGLDAALNSVIRGHNVRTYDQLRQDLAVTDRDWNFPPPESSPTAITSILLMYSHGWSGYSRSGVWDGGSTWNREHTWPDSRGVGQPDSGPDFSDLHHLRACNPSANSARNNNWFAVGGTLAPVASAPEARKATNTWEPPDEDKGWVARACLYMATRYDGTETNTTDLVLVETPPTSVTTNPPQMGSKSVFLAWNRRFPPSEWERRRNQIIFDLYQQNRNPFIDYPEWADVIYEQAEGRETRATWRYRHFTLVELRTAEISGDAADADGDGVPNLLEYALAADPRAADEGLLPRLARSEGGLVFEYRRQRDRALDDLTYLVETTADLTASWSVASGWAEEVAAVDATTELVRVTVPVESSAVFVRLRVSR